MFEQVLHNTDHRKWGWDKWKLKTSCWQFSVYKKGHFGHDSLLKPDIILITGNNQKRPSQVIESETDCVGRAMLSLKDSADSVVQVAVQVHGHDHGSNLRKQGYHRWTVSVLHIYQSWYDRLWGLDTFSYILYTFCPQCFLNYCVHNGSWCQLKLPDGQFPLTSRSGWKAELVSQYCEALFQYASCIRWSYFTSNTPIPAAMPPTMLACSFRPSRICSKQPWGAKCLSKYKYWLTHTWRSGWPKVRLPFVFLLTDKLSAGSVSN